MSKSSGELLKEQREEERRKKLLEEAAEEGRKRGYDIFTMNEETARICEETDAAFERGELPINPPLFPKKGDKDA